MAKTTVELTQVLSIYDLNRFGVFSEMIGLERVISWKTAGGHVNASITVKTDSDLESMHLHYSIRRPMDDEPDSEIDYQVSLKKMPCYYGGYRYYFICPLVVNGVSCHRKVAKLCLPPGCKYFGCRHCYDLAYECSQTYRGSFYWAITRPIRLISEKQRKWQKMSPRQREKYNAVLKKVEFHTRKFSEQLNKQASGR